MALQLHCKRSKIFMRQVAGKKVEKVFCPRGETTNVPDWVGGTDGYKFGIQDKSILDLTPPKVPANARVVVSQEEDGDAEPYTESGMPAPDDGAESVDDGAQTTSKPAVKKSAKSSVPKGLQGGGTVVQSK